jgi:hypothetical protein
LFLEKNMSEEQTNDLVTMSAPEGATSVSFDGQAYEVVDGAVDVPHAAVAEMLSHGYTVGVATEDGNTDKTEAKRPGRPAKAKAGDAK